VLIRHNIWDASVDIWALGCLVSSHFTLSTPTLSGLTINVLYKDIRICNKRATFFFDLTREQIEHEHTALIDEVIDDGSTYTGRFATYLMDRLQSDFG
jgi:serine/threonine-protein kinase SRPK3